MDPRPLRALSRDLVRELGMLSQQCGELALSPLEAHLLIELESGPATNQQLAERLRIDKSNASRPLARLAERELISWHPHPSDGRSKEARLTIAGQAQLLDLHQEMDSAMEETLAQLTLAEREQLWEGLRLYRSALSRARRQQGYRIRPITPADNPAIAAVVRAVSAEYGLTADKGYGVADPNLDFLHETYLGERSRYWVIEGPDGSILGGGGIAPLAGEEGQVCELQKMYFMPSLRGLGLGRRLVLQALDEARALGYQRCYLETTAVLREATALYESLGFEHLPGPLGSTGHDACEICMVLALAANETLPVA
ncbi:bifunctional helix-turn-helix transcriptional regulator/GNAT family N-acetyltransferase [Aeromonas dhakensis]|uniref:bifunctional helix-turn-helix transcriptional regulator/GNAT family N-acetyltransferase n=2 Tax=Aeromonas dhakensis TaxID=196024 RepID=UPI000F45A11F|nr:bifunctional helix-turn-helix transcriptional regulator/GNAT family N-acetyltransferase [Aeromonas dhakensis]CAB5717706.1 Predicted acetyltransferase [Aeromonas hydrophila]EIM1708590.1 bifunctional helix-turn-helix transcriptional regulator/GNAT family N-acetyltransferase [Aeromonas dhakensis]RUQ16581.1 MarR family transcriptional regulator [Aeromonas dhakensis]TND55172.1 MarR family transcriptional regulator [Aeromonas dhakensis]WAF98351.1 bifunctional helix-turn-helix transcriptional regu